MQEVQTFKKKWIGSSSSNIITSSGGKKINSRHLSENTDIKGFTSWDITASSLLKVN
jgi:hypothetical protein